jgi:hypothetical protein
MNHPEELFIPIIAIISTFGIPGFVLWKFIEARNRERMAIIEKGMAAEEIRQLFMREKSQSRNPNPLTNLKWGLLIFFVGIGALIGRNMSTWVYEAGFGHYNSNDMIPAGVLIGGGLGLIIFYGIAAKKEKETKTKTIEKTQE